MKFSIITPVHNGEKYIAETIESILSQKGDFEIEYIIRDGGSTDQTVEIIRGYKDRLDSCQYPISCRGITMSWVSEKDGGMYDAIEKGFAGAQGNIFAYLNADDKYLPGAFASVSKIFEDFPEIEWVKGINKKSDEQGVHTSTGSCLLYQQNWLAKGIYGRCAYFVQQDSVFWRKSLWEKSRPSISKLKLAGDYVLWVGFAKFTPLWSFNKPVSVFRKRPGQLSTDMTAYRHEQDISLSHQFFLEKRVLIFFQFYRLLNLQNKKVLGKMLRWILFPFYKQQWYIDFDTNNNPVKKPASSFLV